VPHFYFHLSNSEETIRDNTGWSLPDVRTAHSRALKLAERVIGFACLENRGSDFRRWRVDVMEQDHRSALTVLLATCVVSRTGQHSEFEGARALH
jgi:hypothetical protein